MAGLWALKYAESTATVRSFSLEFSHSVGGDGVQARNRLHIAL